MMKLNQMFHIHTFIGRWPIIPVAHGLPAEGIPWLMKFWHV